MDEDVGMDGDDELDEDVGLDGDNDLGGDKNHGSYHGRKK